TVDRPEETWPGQPGRVKAEPVTADRDVVQGQGTLIDDGVERGSGEAQAPDRGGNAGADGQVGRAVRPAAAEGDQWAARRGEVAEDRQVAAEGQVTGQADGAGQSRGEGDGVARGGGGDLAAQRAVPGNAGVAEVPHRQRARHGAVFQHVQAGH